MGGREYCSPFPYSQPTAEIRMASMGATPTRRPGAHTVGKEPSSSPPGRLAAGDSAQRVLKPTVVLLCPQEAGLLPLAQRLPGLQCLRPRMAALQGPASLLPCPQAQEGQFPQAQPLPRQATTHPLCGARTMTSQTEWGQRASGTVSTVSWGVRGHGCWGTKCVSPQESQAWHRV